MVSSAPKMRYLLNLFITSKAKSKYEFKFSGVQDMILKISMNHAVLSEIRRSSRTLFIHDLTGGLSSRSFVSIS